MLSNADRIQIFPPKLVLSMQLLHKEIVVMLDLNQIVLREEMGSDGMGQIGITGSDF